ncbi:MAG: hypothetical protein EA409_06515 [Saprospirales bacterium]|nr:MAG: hypothetical protein EA409_06515 [Saprospirales bacterium]
MREYSILSSLIVVSIDNFSPSKISGVHNSYQIFISRIIVLIPLLYRNQTLTLFKMVRFCVVIDKCVIFTPLLFTMGFELPFFDEIITETTLDFSLLLRGK